MNFILTKIEIILFYIKSFIIMGYVYLLCDSGQDNLFKIGVTKGSIEKRIKKLQTGNGSEIFITDYYETKNPFFVENMLHLRFKTKNKLNEWFELDADDVIHFKDYCKECEETIESIKDNPYMKKYKLK